MRVGVTHHTRPARIEQEQIALQRMAEDWAQRITKGFDYRWGWVRDYRLDEQPLILAQPFLETYPEGEIFLGI